jgi:hypothetical protein
VSGSKRGRSPGWQFSTWKPGHLIDRITNHKPTGVTDRVYNKYDYLREKQEALNAWGARLSRIVSDLELVASSTGSEA